MTTFPSILDPFFHDDFHSFLHAFDPRYFPLFLSFLFLRGRAGQTERRSRPVYLLVPWTVFKYCMKEGVSIWGTCYSTCCSPWLLPVTGAKGQRERPFKAGFCPCPWTVFKNKGKSGSLRGSFYSTCFLSSQVFRIVRAEQSQCRR